MAGEATSGNQNFMNIMNVHSGRYTCYDKCCPKPLEFLCSRPTVDLKAMAEGDPMLAYAGGELGVCGSFHGGHLRPKTK